MITATNFNLQEFIQDTIDGIEGMLKKKYQKVEFTYTGETQVHQDKKILRNILLNLLSNAVKYSPPEKTIFVDASVQEHIISIAVKDQGIGIPHEAQQHLFGKFYRAENAVNIQGTGLGLNIVKRYIELLDGHIHFVSKQHKGSTFTIQLPRVKK